MCGLHDLKEELLYQETNRLLLFELFFLLQFVVSSANYSVDSLVV